MKDEDFLKGLLIGKMLSDSKKNGSNSSGGGGGGCFSVILFVIGIIVAIAMFRSCFIGEMRKMQRLLFWITNIAKKSRHCRHCCVCCQLCREDVAELRD